MAAPVVQSLVRSARWLAGALLAAALTVAATMPGHAQSAKAELSVGAMADFTVLAEPAPVPENRFIDADGRELGLDDFRGKVVLVNFWATWCGPCRREMPDLDRLQAELGGDSFQVVAISSDRQGVEVVRKFYDELGIKHLAIYNDKGMRVARAFRAFGLPTSVLLNANGQEVGRLTGPAEWASDDAKRLIRHFIDAGSG